MKNILIISKCSHEVSTEEVMDWIILSGNKPFRINGDDIENLSSLFYITNQNGEIRIKLEDIDFCNFYSVWLRRWSDMNWTKQLNGLKESKFKNEITDNMTTEIGAVRDFFLNSIKTSKWLTRRSQLRVSKLSVFDQAVRVGLNTPDYLITNNKRELLQFYKLKQKIVTKDIDSQFILDTISEVGLSYVELVRPQDIDVMPERFLLTMFQEYIEKEFEIRTFFLDDQLYSMAIFSQRDSQTSVDFRKYNRKSPNRNVPYKLPDFIEKKIWLLMKNIGLNTGSLDLIKTPDGKYYFLEVNPVGQFGMVSFPCNYNLEEKISNYLTS